MAVSIRFIRRRHDLIDAARALVAKGLNKGTAGNVSLRVEGGYLITPSGMPADALQPRDIVFMEPDGTAHGRCKPSSEWRFHQDIYAHYPDVQAVVHAHPDFSTTLACLSQSIPAFHYMVAVAGGDDVPCVPYATFGSQALSDYVVQGLSTRRACLLAHHGLVATGQSLAGALKLAVEVEELATQFWRILQINPNPPLLPKDEMARVLDKFKSYGSNAQNTAKT